MQAGLLATLARVTSYDEQYLIWDLPLSRAWQYQHAEWVRNQIECYSSVEEVDMELSFEQLKSKYVKAKEKVVSLKSNFI